MQAEAERACDDLVLAPGSRPADYAQHILHIASGLQVGLSAVHAGIALARPHKLERRIRAILDATRTRRRLTLGSIFLAAVLALLRPPEAVIPLVKAAKDFQGRGITARLGLPA
ncbi:hypothetical protein LCGC14_2444220 [marine sediment metagenome]|uniref:Uncharacterized protein n=1 Tax=marine sediment metagenome TaxID=412755 RepID=A0A0F9C5H7_9ZZZZ